MNDVKVNLSIVLPGRTMMSKEECLKTTHIAIKKNGKKRIIEKKIEDWDKMDKHLVKVKVSGQTKPEIMAVYTRKCIPASQSINISKDSYDYMTKGDCPSFSKPKEWAKLSKKARLEAHLQSIMEHLGGISYTYQVFDD